MKTNAEKTAKAAATTAPAMADYSFFARKGKGDLFIAPKPAATPVTHFISAENRNIEPSRRKSTNVPGRAVITPAAPLHAKTASQERRAPGTERREAGVEGDERLLEREGRNEAYPVPPVVRRPGGSPPDGNDRGDGSHDNQARGLPAAASPDLSRGGEQERDGASGDGHGTGSASAGGVSGQPGGGKDISGGTEGEPAPVSMDPAGKTEGENGASTLLKSGSASNSPLMSLAMEQALLIQGDCIMGQAHIARSAAIRRLAIDTFFAGARSVLTSLFLRSILAIYSFILTKRVEIISAAASATSLAQSVIGNTLRAVQGVAGQFRARINGALEGVLSSVRGLVNGIASRIIGLIDSVQLPDIPLIGRIRAAAVNLLNRGAGKVNSAFSIFVNFARTAFNGGMNLFDTFVGAVAGALQTAVSYASLTIRNLLRKIFDALLRFVSRIIAILGRILRGVILPALKRLRDLIVRYIGRAERLAINLLAMNRTRYISRISELLFPPHAARAGGSASADAREEAVRRLGREAMANSRLIVRAFDILIGGGVITSIVALISAIARVAVVVATFISKVYRVVASVVGTAFRRLTELGHIITGFVQELFRTLAAGLGQLFQSLFSMIQRGAEQLSRFVTDCIRRIADFIGRFVRSLIQGGGFPAGGPDLTGLFTLPHGPITRPSPGPIIVPRILYGILAVFAVIGALVAYAFPQLAAAIAFLVSLGLSSAAAFAILGVIIAIGFILLLVILYLIIRWLIRPSPPGPPKDPTITHETVFSTPDGSPKSREDVGVGEKVVFTGSAAGRWSATSGSPASASGGKFTWTAPDRGATATISLSAGGRSSSIVMRVIEPEGITAVRNSTISYRPGRQGAGMKLTFNYRPMKVSFGNVDAKEVSGPASNVWGYFTRYNLPDLWHDSGDTFYGIGKDNRDTAEDTASFYNYPSPWEAGGYQWKIPNHFRTKTEGGDGKLFTYVFQVFTIVDASGRSKVEKAGSSVERSP